mgnify:CR=1 FL=1
MRRIQKPLAWLLSIMLIFTALPLTAFADETIPAADSMPTTEDVLEPMLDDTPLPTPEPTPEVTIEPMPEPTPETTPEPMPEATTEPTPKPSPAPETTSEPTETPTATPESSPAPEASAVPTATPEPTASPSAAPTPAPTPTPVPVEDPYVPGFTVIESEIGGTHAWPVPEHFDVTQGYGDQHAALDIAADTGTPVIATDDGTITVTQTWNGIVTKGDSNSYGNMVQVTHADGTVTLYAHLSEINVRQGDTVVRGQQIGRVGSTGNSSGPHLHFEVRSNGSKVDPMVYITEDSTDAEKHFEELLEQYGGYIGEDGQLRTIDGREAIDKTLVEIAEEAGLNPPVFYANNVTVTESRSTYIMNIGYKTNVEDMNGWGGKRVNGRVAYCVEHGVALGLGDNGGYTQRELTKEQLAKLTLIDYWGRYKNIANVKGCSAVNYNWDTIDVSAEYMAEFYTQLLIWETINSFGGSFVGASSVSIPSTVGGMDNIASQSTYNAFKKAVLAKVDQFYTTPSIDGQTVSMKIGETVTLTDTTGALVDYGDTPVVNTSGVSVTKSGNKITITATGTPKESGVVRFAYNIDRAYDDKGPGYYYEHSVSQDVVSCGFGGRDPRAITLNVNVEMNGSLKIVKTSEDGVVSGVRFRVTGNGVNTTVQTGPDGTITIPNLQAGSKLTITELDVKDKYVTPKSQTVTIEANKTATVTFSNILKKWTATITKVDKETGTAQGDASLAGAVYGVYRGNDLIDRYTTDSRGQFVTKEYICGDNWSIREISPSSGYLLDSTVYPVVAEPGNYSLEHNKIEITVREQVIKGKVQIHKQYEVLNGPPADESGAVFEVYLKSAGSYEAAKESERDAITTNAAGYAITKDMPCGTYIVHQSKGGAGRETVDDFEVVVAENGKTYSYELLNELKNGQLKIIKTSDTGKVEGISFRVTRLKDNYSKVYKTDASGLILTETLPIFEDNAGTTKYQYLVEELDTEETFGYELPDPQIVTLQDGGVAEVKFHNVPLEIGTTAKFEDGTKDTQSANDVVLVDTVSYSGLQIGKEYTVSGILMDKATGKPFLDFDGHEVKAETTFTPESRDGTVDVIFKFNSLNIKLDTDVVVFETLYREGMELTTHADIDDEGQTVKIRVPEIGTTATSEDGHRVDPLGEVKITDEVSYKNLKPGKEYTVSGVLMDKTTGDVFLDAAGNEIRSEVVFTPEEPTGTVTVEFTFDASDLHGTQIVVFEHLYYDGLLLATHAELEDEGQTVEIKNPKISTIAVVEDGGKTTLTADDVQITDTISYSDLTAGVEYRMTGILMDKATGEVFLDFDGKPVTAEAVFVPEKDDGEAGDADKGAAEPGKGPESAEEGKDPDEPENGSEGEGDGISGEVELTFTFNSLNLKKDTELVVFDELYRVKTNTLIAEHKDIEAESQTVKIFVPKIGTTAEFEDGSKEIIANKEIVVIDTVSYKDLKPGREYTVSGILMDKATGSPFLDADGNIVVGKTVFTPEEPTGTVEVEFRFNANFVQEDTEIVVFEDLYYGDVQLTTHADLEDESQTVTVHPLHGFVEVLKLNNMDNSPLAGTKFGIFRAETDELVEEIVTSESGMAKSGPLLFGPYYLLEIDPSHGFLPSDTRYDFFIDEDGEIISFEITNTAKIGKMDMSYHEGNTPRTGDTRPILLCMLLSLLSGSAVIVLLAFRKRKNASKLILSLALSLLTVAIMSAPIHVDAATTDTPEISVSGDTLTMTKEIISLDRNEQIDFAETITEDGKTYRLIDVSSSVISDTAVTEEQVLSVQREEIVADKSASIADTYTQDGVTYSLKDVQFQPHEITDYTATVTEDVLLGPAVSQPDADDSITVPYHIDEYDLTLDCTLPLSSVSSGSPYWLDDVRIPMQIYDTGALYMEFNGQVLPFDGSTPPLAGFEDLFLDYLGLSGDTYRLTSAAWDGDPYTENGTECRDAIISGSRLVSDYTAHYGGEITLSPFTVYDATATYEAVQTVETGETEYTIQAVAQYEEDHSTLTAVIIGAAVGIIGIAAAVAIILAILAKKRKRKEASK